LETFHKEICQSLIVSSFFESLLAAYLLTLDDETRASVIDTKKESLIVHVNKDSDERVKVEIKDET
jgi:hypothetical protein